MRLSCKQDEGILLGLFHTTADPVQAIEQLIVAIKDQFMDAHHDTHESLRPELDSMADEKMEPLVGHPLQERYFWASVSCNNGGTADDRGRGARTF